MYLIDLINFMIYFVANLIILRSRDLCTASNRLLISLLSADFLLLINCYMNVYQGLKGYPIVGKYGKLSWINRIQRIQELPIKKITRYKLQR